ncbi:MAG TPA: ATP-grasp domain-containing protein [Bryobacteraceae bacterium]|nr:ATP-grasp domain-containing protein [Bryobacteraceae bacterium]
MSERKRVVLVAATTGYQTRMFGEAAERAGINLILATDRCHVLEDPWGDRALPLKFDQPEGAADVIAAAGRVDGIVAVGDRPAYVASLVAERLGLRFHPPTAVTASRSKFLARERFRAAGLLVPEFFRLPVASEPSESTFYPCVLKPLGLSASRGVIRADNAGEFRAAFHRIRALLDDPDIRRMHDEQDRFIQVESFIVGREFALEGIVTNGKLRNLALFDKPDPLNGPFFEETIYVTPSREGAAVQEAIEETTQQAISALGLTHGPIHAEMRANDRGIWMLEVAARPIGGLCAKALPGLEELILRHAVGEVNPPLPEIRASGVMMIPIPREGVFVGVEGVPDHPEVIITAKKGQKLVPLPEGNSYLGFIFANGESPGKVEQTLRRTHSLLRFDIAGALPVI